VLFRCAYERGDAAGAARFEQRAWRLRTVQAAALTNRGAMAAQAGNGGLGSASTRPRRAQRLPSRSSTSVTVATRRPSACSARPTLPPRAWTMRRSASRTPPPP
jgi:hypothetical protein